MLRMKRNNRITLEQPSTTTSTNDLHSFTFWSSFPLGRLQNSGS